MKRVVVSIFGLGALLLIGIVIYQVSVNWLILRPASLLTFSASYENFQVHSDAPVDPAELSRVADHVGLRLDNILDYGREQQTVFLCNDPEIFGAFARKAGRSQNVQGFNLQPLDYIFINLDFIGETRDRNTTGHQYSILEGSESHIVAHEICHGLITRRLGYWKMRRTESWKQEGFCEYAATVNLKKRDASYRFEDFASAYFAGEYQRYPPGKQFYIGSQLAAEYFLDHNNGTFEELMNTEIQRAEILAEIEAVVNRESRTQPRDG